MSGARGAAAGASSVSTRGSGYARDRAAFLKDLKQFNDTKNIPTKPVIVNSKELDLYQFYQLVQQRGGVGKVNQQGGWDSFLRPLRLPHPCVNGSALLRRLYGSCLERYERARGPPGRDDDNDMEEDFRRHRGGGGPPRYPHYAASEWTRPSVRVAGPSERLALSLLSPMPNEQDFAVNVCTVLAADFSNRLPLNTAPHILDFLLAHAGVYNHPSLRDTIGRSYKECRGMSPDEFWAARAGGGGSRELADETAFMSFCPTERPDLMVQALAAQNALSDRLLRDEKEEKEVQDMVDEILTEEMPTRPEAEDWMSEPSEEEQLFAPQLSGGARCPYTQRVIQVASIARSLSFHDENLPHLSRHTTLLRFLLLCANCWVGTLRQSGLDSLGNISQELIIKDPATCLLSQHVLSTVQAALASPDRARVVAALELLNKLAQNEANEDVLLRALDPKVYEEVCALLSLRDIMVLVSTLECVYALTSLGERACERAVRVSGLVRTLVSLLTVEAQSYGPKACILMRVVETVSGPQEAAQPASQAQPAAPAGPTQPPPTQPSTPVKSRQPAVEPETSRVAAPPAVPPAPAPPPLPAPAAAAVAPTPTNNVQQSHAHQQQVQENEQFALAWLRAAWEPCAVVVSNTGSEVTELYRQYVACCKKVGRKALIAPSHFPRLVRTVFGGTVGPKALTVASGETQQVYVGIRARNIANRSASQVHGPASPILKAQLTNIKQDQQQSKPQVPQTMSAAPPAQHPHLSQALETATATPAAGSSNTTLIKHLLAHKVAQRQNQQRMLGQPTNSGHNTSAAMEVDPEALIKCTTITPAGVASTTPHSDKINTGPVVQMQPEESTVKEETMQIQITEDQSQVTMKAAQNKMLADLLEKKSTPPVQIVQMAPQMNAPTIQITETGQILQVKNDSPVVQVKTESSQMVPQQGQYVQIKNDQGQIIHLKNDQGQIIHIKNDHGQIFQIKSDQLLNQSGQQMLQIKNEQGQILQHGQMLQGGQMLQSQQIIHQGGQIIQQGGQIIQQGGQIMQQGGQIIQQGGQIMQQGGQIIQQGGQIIQQGGQIMQQGGPIMQQGGQIIQQGGQIIQVQGQMIQPITLKTETEPIETIVLDGDSDEPPSKKVKTEEKRESPPKESVSKTAANLYAALAASALEDEEDLLPRRHEAIPQKVTPVQQPSVQMQQQPVHVQQPVLQVQPMDMQQIMVSQSGQLILQEKPIVSQSTQFMQQPMQLIAAPGTGQGGLSYITQNLQGNMMQQHKTIIIVQGGGGGTPITLTVSNPGGLDESTLNSLISQASEAITQQQIIQNTGVIQPTQRVIHSQPALINPQGLAVVKQSMMQNQPQLTGSQQPIITSQPHPHKAQIQSHVNQQGPQQLVVTQKQPQQQIISQGSQIVSQGNQIMSQGNQIMSQGNQIMSQGNQIMSQGNQIISQGNQMVTVSANQQLQANQIVTVSGNQQIMSQGSQVVTVSGNQQIISGNQPMVGAAQQMSGSQIVTVAGNQQFMAVPGQQQIIMNAPLKSGVHRVVQQPQRSQAVAGSLVQQPAIAQTENKPTTVIQSNVTQKTPVSKPGVQMRQVITRTPVMVGNTKIGDKEVVTQQPIGQDTPPPLHLKPQPVKAQPPAAPPPARPAQEDTPWICHWKGCGKTFEGASSVFSHAARAHCPPAASGEAPCLWLDCDRVPRRTFALLNHLHDRHCTADALRATFNSRRHVASEADGSKSVSLGYPPNAALAALNKHAVDFLNPRELMDDNEGPVTKSIRLTAALILRNLVIYSNNGRRQLRLYEHHLSTIALSSVEASRTIAQVLYDMNNI